MQIDNSMRYDDCNCFNSWILVLAFPVVFRWTRLNRSAKIDPGWNIHILLDPDDWQKWA